MPTTVTSPKVRNQASSRRYPAAVVGNDWVPSTAPRWSHAAATCTSAWVSTPPMTAAAADVMVVMPVLFRRWGGTGTHKPTVGQDRDGASSQAPTRSLPPAVRAQGVSRPVDGSLRGQPLGASRSFGSDRAGERRYPTSLPFFPTWRTFLVVSIADDDLIRVRIVYPRGQSDEGER